MAFINVNGWDVEHASNLLAYDNLFPAVQHINGKGVTDKWTNTKDVDRVTYIDIIRVLPYSPEFRQLGASNNGGYHNAKNVGGYNNAPQSVHYTVAMNLYYDTGLPITQEQEYSNEVELKRIIVDGLLNSVALTINTITYAKQIEGYFRNGDNFDKAKTHTVGNIVQGDITDAELAAALFSFDPAVAGLNAGSPTLAFQKANAKLNDGVREIGAFVVPMNQRQAFITNDYDVLIKGQYAQNASEAAARILATGYVNPFTGETARIDERTGLLGMYDGVDMFMFSAFMRDFVYIALGLGDTSDADILAARAILDKIAGFIVYGGGTLRGIVGPYIEVNKHPFQNGVYVVPRLKMGVEVLHGASIKMIINAGASLNSGWSKANIATIMNTIKFTPIDGVVVKSNTVAGFNDGTTN